MFEGLLPAVQMSVSRLCRSGPRCDLACSFHEEWGYRSPAADTSRIAQAVSATLFLLVSAVKGQPVTMICRSCRNKLGDGQREVTAPGHRFN